ncbi:hypothetical protein [Cupriavidus consociatus]|uniref:hypothetical protein n=1 Tax=Cupriavidus consociatus TaxID=2821357 RepID=UPI001AEAB6FF|nr:MULTISPECIES: hypothetical protein [unclassified Cupriavidus]MBP0622871.1 hypothetical protein [Cupriavidus sp. LEh25]MDK2659558.1 hypothetical protein [Cupriavidus sp. LEh21]
MPHKHTDWSELAYRASEVLFARKGKNVKDVVDLLVEEKVASARGLEAKLKRGTYRFALFLELMSVLGVDAPPEWQPLFVTNDLSYATRARLVLIRELNKRNLDRSGFLARLRDAHIRVPRNDSSEEAMEDGTFTMVLMLQLAALAPVEGMERFVDMSDVLRVASQSAKGEM